MWLCLGNLLKLRVAQRAKQELHPPSVAQDVNGGSTKQTRVVQGVSMGQREPLPP